MECGTPSYNQLLLLRVHGDMATEEGLPACLLDWQQREEERGVMLDEWMQQPNNTSSSVLLTSFLYHQKTTRMQEKEDKYPPSLLFFVSFSASVLFFFFVLFVLFVLFFFFLSFFIAFPSTLSARHSIALSSSSIPLFSSSSFRSFFHSLPSIHSFLHSSIDLTEQRLSQTQDKATPTPIPIPDTLSETERRQDTGLTPDWNTQSILIHLIPQQLTIWPKTWVRSRRSRMRPSLPLSLPCSSTVLSVSPSTLPSPSSVPGTSASTSPEPTSSAKSKFLYPSFCLSVFQTCGCLWVPRPQLV